MVQTKFHKASKYIRLHYTSTEINEMWNASGLGRPCNVNTTDRWCNKGPASKNKHFESWLMTVVGTHKKDLLTSFMAPKRIQTNPVDHNNIKSHIELLRRSPDNAFKTVSDSAHAAAFVVLYDRLSHLSSKEQQYVERLTSGLSV